MMQDYLTVNIDGQEIKTRRGEKILWAALDNGIYIPNLCAIREAEIPFGGCRICLVEISISGKSKIVTACSEPVKERMVITTKSDKLSRLRTTSFELILSNHEIDCPSCPGFKKCQLLKIAAYLKVKVKYPERFKRIEKNLPADLSHPNFGYNPNKCIKCGKCVFACRGLLSFVNYGLDTSISTFNHTPLGELGCDACLECLKVCPVGAFFER
ncbi:MAG: NADPH-Fe(3+) oxidoreductase subunit alpha [candidate division WS2 bacterium]|uniref:NADPH-Fe(3+) oxidoreductase subunit alpha n=1 Tax=Psychracetigena formicireducens TaxID=2986056 RepID=A0A9E2BLX9_PSYF1|nr:NADPH-Fe(3+) oxidoreductase subunit alpha [Candidatus Psychracetigena formicireducens]MBT9145419.1 NADPH-Fe(3+) oxidoreductase subunit alpha [Candidatus Psychracetigena formicireducens]MBT9150595.1 NADPH-Fe(3+) oxidoreductase subunit alpha [Candidatus Psychracetigena formicireducens]